MKMKKKTKYLIKIILKIVLHFNKSEVARNRVFLRFLVETEKNLICPKKKWKNMKKSNKKVKSLHMHCQIYREANKYHRKIINH